MATSLSTTSANASLAQSFTVSTPKGIPGIYTPGLDLYFAKKSSSFGVQVQIVEMSQGVPDVANPVSGATAVVDSSSVTTSLDGSAATSFAFPGLVFLDDGVTYAIVVKPLGAAPDYQLFTGLGGGIDLATGAVVSSNPVSGDLYYAQNSGVWSAIPNEDMKYSLNRCVFDTVDPAYASLIKSNTEILILSDPSFLSGPIDVGPGDEVFGITNGAANTLIHANVTKYDPVNQFLYCEASTGNFAANTQIQVVRVQNTGSLTGAFLQCIATVGSLFNIRADGIAVKLGNPSDSSTSIGYQFRGAIQNGTSFVPSASWMSVPVQSEIGFSDATRFILSKSNETGALAVPTSAGLQVTMSSNTDYLSPMVDMRQHSIIAYTNQINSDVTGEATNFGSAMTRYISETVNLATGMDAETMNVWIDAYRPVGTQIYVYAKIWNAADPDSFDNEAWSLLTQVTNAAVYSSPGNISDTVEYQYTFGSTAPAGTPSNGGAYQPIISGSPGVVTYTNSFGTFNGFASFAIKVVLAVTGTNTNVVPILADIRAIAGML
jgi:hypothetical protein